MDKSGAMSIAGTGHNEKINAEGLIGAAQVDKDVILESLISSYSADILRLANRLLGWPGDVDDIVQDVFLAAYTGLDKFRGESEMKTWLFSITINKCRTNRYKKMLSLKFLEKFSEKFRGLTVPSAIEKPMMDEICESVRGAVSSLPVKYREAVVLKYLQELKTDEIMQVLGITENTLNVRLSRAKKILNRKLSGLIEG